MSLTFYVQSNLTASIHLEDMQQLARTTDGINYNILGPQGNIYLFEMPWTLFVGLISNFIKANGYIPYNDFLLIEDMPNLAVNVYMIRKDKSTITLPHNNLINLFTSVVKKGSIDSIVLEFTRNPTQLYKGIQHGIRQDMLTQSSNAATTLRDISNRDPQIAYQDLKLVPGIEAFNYDNPDDANWWIWLIIIILIIGGCWYYYKNHKINLA
jgi:hypothetical protein